MSQADSVKLTVGQHSYDCFKLDPWVMNEITLRIMKTLGGAVGELAMAFLAGGGELPTGGVEAALDQKIKPEHLAKGVGEAMRNLSADDARWLMEQLAQKTTIQGGDRLSAVWSAHFLGRPVDMYKWAVAALRSQYDFSG